MHCRVTIYLLWKKEKISLLYSYHYEKIWEEDKKGGAASGQGVMLIGFGILLSGVTVAVTDSEWSFSLIPIVLFVSVKCIYLFHFFFAQLKVV